MDENLDLEELEKIKYNPYRHIRSHYESMLPCIGSRIFSILSLIPISLILPKIKVNKREIRIHLNFLWLSPSGYGKSSIVREFEKISYSPLSTKKMTTPRLYQEIRKRGGDKMTLIVEDVAVWFMDEEKIKFLEGITGEEESVSHETMRNMKEESRHVDLVSFCSGTPSNITSLHIKEGILRRFSPLIIYLSPEEHKKIVKFINNNIGVDGQVNDSKEIKAFYQELYSIQEGKHKEISPIIGYIFPNEIKEQASVLMEKLTNGLNAKYGSSFATETEELWRFMICHAFLNIFNKNRNGMIENNHLIIDQEDFIAARRLITREISNKSIILQCIESLDYYGIKTRTQLMDWEKRRRLAGKAELPKEAQFVLESNVR